VTLLQSDAVPSRPRVCPRLFVGPLVWLGALGAIGLGGAACDGATSVTITSAAAGHLWEGLGCGTRGCEGTCTVDGCPGGRRAPLVLVATDAPLVSASATIPGTDIDVHVDVLAQAAGRAALAVRIPVTTALGAGEHDLELEVVATDGSAATTRLSAQTFDELVQMVRGARGRDGSGTDYVQGIAGKLAELKIEDQAVIDLWAALQRLSARS